MENPYRLVSTREVYRNPWIRVREDRVVRADGGDGLFGIVDMKPGSSVLAIDDAGLAHLVDEFKYGVQRVSREVISGGLEPGETPLETAKRELKEETGLEAREWIDLGVIDPFTSAIYSHNYLFLALGVTHGERSPDEGEHLEVVQRPFRQALEMVLAGEITHAASCVLILKADRILRERPWYGT
jgi:8-oxo-dGTP pyrophosphatase MutT (NUDIX family)